jgi:hypothetical protein
MEAPTVQARAHTCLSTHPIEANVPHVAAGTDTVLADYLLAPRENRGGRDKGGWPRGFAVEVAEDEWVGAGAA